MIFKIINNDSLNELKKMKDNSIDYVITSPPYNMNLRIRNGEYCSRQIVKEFSTKYQGFDDNLNMDDYFEFHKSIINELLRVTKNHIFYIIQPVTGNKPALYRLLGEFHKNIKETIIWNKIYGQPAMANNVVNSAFEFIFVLSSDVKDSMSRQFKNGNFERGKIQNIWDIKRKRSKNINHSATFPEELVDKIILNFTNEGETILDPFSGTGTTGISCLNNNRKYIGIELLKEYADFSIEELGKIKKSIN